MGYTPRHVRSVGLRNIGARVQVTFEFAPAAGICPTAKPDPPTHHDLPGFRPDPMRFPDVIDRTRELTMHRKVYIDPASGAVSLNASGELDLAGMLASEGLGTITTG